jgi:hypothetical protein
VENLRKNGVVIYEAIEYDSSGGDFFNCRYEKNIDKINRIIPCDTFWVIYKDTFDLKCKVYISYEYLKKLKQYAIKNTPRRKNKIKFLTKIEYDSIKYYHDSIDFYDNQFINNN